MGHWTARGVLVPREESSGPRRRMQQTTRADQRGRGQTHLDRKWMKGRACVRAWTGAEEQGRRLWVRKIRNSTRMFDCEFSPSYRLPGSDASDDCVRREGALFASRSFPHSLLPLPSSPRVTQQTLKKIGEQARERRVQSLRLHVYVRLPDSLRDASTTDASGREKA